MRRASAAVLEAVLESFRGVLGHEVTDRSSWLEWGSSISAMQILSELRSKELVLELECLFVAPTPTRLARHLFGAGDSHPEDEPMYCMHAARQTEALHG
jgi:hypothetical protein